MNTVFLKFFIVFIFVFATTYISYRYSLLREGVETFEN